MVLKFPKKRFFKGTRNQAEENKKFFRAFSKSFRKDTKRIRRPW